MTISQYIVIEESEQCRCASCGAPLAVGDTVSECDGKPFCGAECVSEHVGKMMARLHGGREQAAEKNDGETNQIYKSS